MTYKKLSDLVSRFASALADLGIKKGSTVALYLYNSPQFIISYFAILTLGAIVVPIDPFFTSKELRHHVNDCEARTIICDSVLFDYVQKSGADLDNIIISRINYFMPLYKKILKKSRVVRMDTGHQYGGADRGKQPEIHFFSKLIKNYHKAPPAIYIHPEKEVAVLSYTAGTTGMPKAVMLTHSNFIAAQTQIRHSWPFLKEGKEVILTVFPLYSITAQAIGVFLSLLNGFTLVLLTTPDIDDVLLALERYNVSIFLAVPSTFEYLNNYLKTDRVDWKRLSLILCSADTLHESTIEDWELRTDTHILEIYGMTETTGISHANPYNESIAGSFGIPVPGSGAGVIEIDGTDFLPANSVGELILKGPHIMGGYWKKPDKTKENMIYIDGDTWLRTGDLVKMDDNGFFFFFDRKKDLIKIKDSYVFAKDVEEVLYQHPKIKSTGVVGIYDKTEGYLIKAYVVLQNDARGKISEDQIIEFCKESLDDYQIPDIIEFRGELPKTDEGKISRKDLRADSEEKSNE